MRQAILELIPEDELLELLADSKALKKLLESPVGRDLAPTIHALAEQLEQLDILLKHEPIAGYIPNLLQDPFHRSHCRGRFMFGANRVGKSTALVLEMYAMTTGKRPWWDPSDPDHLIRLWWNDFDPLLPQFMPVPNVGRSYVGHDYSAWDRDMEGEWRAWVPKNEYKMVRNTAGHVDKILMTKTGSVIHLFSNQTQPEKSEGGKTHWVSYNEPPKMAHFEAAQARLIDVNGPYFGAMTLLEAEPWVFDKIYSNDNSDGEIDVFEGPTELNTREYGGVLAAKAIEGGGRTLSQAMKDARFGGIPLQKTGRILKGFQKAPPHWIEPVPIEAWWPRFMAIDPHPQKPIAMLWGVVDPRHRILYIVWNVYDPALDDPDKLVEEIKRVESEIPFPHWNGDRGIVEMKPLGPAQLRLIDPSSKTPGPDRKVTMHRELAKRGYYCHAWDRTNLDDQILAFRPRFTPRERPEGIPEVVVFDNCQVLAREIEHWYWDPKTGKPRKARPDDEIQDNLIDCLRAMCTHDVIGMAARLEGPANAMTQTHLQSIMKQMRNRSRRGGY